jgi:hypothetical protein
MTYKQEWTSIEIEYESLVDDAGGTKPKIQMELEKLFGKANIENWSKPGFTDISAKPPSMNHAFVIEILMKELNGALSSTGNSPNIDIQPQDLVMSIVSPYPIAKAPGMELMELLVQPYEYLTPRPTAAGADKDIHTRCKLFGDKWINTRSYRLSRVVAQHRQAWLPLSHEGSPYIVATLAWQCWPVA